MIGEQEKQSALVVIDVQNAVVDDPIHDAERVLNTIADLLQGARAAGMPVVYVRHQEPESEAMRAGSEGWQIHDAVAPQEGEIIVEKQWNDAFAATDLQHQLRQLGVRHLYLTGCETDACVRATHVGALAHGYDVTLIADAHSLGTQRPGATFSAEQIIAYHNEVAPFLSYPGAGTRVIEAAQVRFTAEPVAIGI